MSIINNPLMINQEAEEAVLGLMLVSEEACDKILMRLTARDFENAKNREVFRAVNEMRQRRTHVDLVTASQSHPELDSLYLVDLVTKAPVTGAVALSYCDVLKECAARRDFDRLGRAIQKEAGSSEFDSGALTEKIRLHLKGISQADGEDTGIRDALGQMYDAIFERPKEGEAIRLDIPALDGMTGGLKPKRMYVVGARPSVGKTVFGMVAALKCALQGKPVLYVNREMDRVDMLKRMTAHLTGVNLNALEGQCVEEADWEKVVDGITLMDKSPIHISDRARTPAQIRQKAVELKEKDGLGLVVVDYLQRMSAGAKYKSRDEEIGAISMALKDMAMDLDVPVILLSQLNRSASNMRPNMAMLRESGNIEQDADVIVLLHAPDTEDIPGGRRDEYLSIRENRGKYLEMIVDKNRHGQTGIVPVGFYGDKMRYVPLKGTK